MERSEPALVPEWLKSSGSNSTSQHFASSSSHSDDHASTLPARSRLLASSAGDYDSSRSSAFTEKSSSSLFNRSSGSNGLMIHEKNTSAYPRSYSSSCRSHRDKDWDADLLDFCSKKRPFLGEDHRDRYMTSLGANSNPFMSRAEKDALRRSRSSLSGKWSELRSRRDATDMRGGNTSDHTSNVSMVVGGTMAGSTHKATFEREFPSLGAEERQVPSDIARLPSPGLSSGIQNLPISSSSVIVRDGWTSALAEVPVTIGCNNIGLASVKQSAPANLATVVPSTTTGLNMAETLAQAPLRARSAPQVSVETQRLEELAIKQSRQLIPMTPLMPKASVLSSEKLKQKTAPRNEVNLVSKIGHQQISSSQVVNHSLRGGNAKADTPKTGHVGKFHVLKLTREQSGNATKAKDSSARAIVVGVANNRPTTAPLSTTSPIRGLNSQKYASTEYKPSSRPVHSSAMEKRYPLSQAQSRNDFFNSMRKKSSLNPSASTDPTPVLPSNILESSGELNTEGFSTPVTPKANDLPSADFLHPDWSTLNGTELSSNGNGCGELERKLNNGEKRSSTIEVVYSDEEEVAFLRSLGWEENPEEEEGLTEEEINSFYQMLQVRPSLKLNREILQRKLSSPFKNQVGSFDSVSSGLGSSDSDS